MEKQRKHFTSEEKVRLLRRHLLESIPVSQICEETGIRPALFYHWQQIFFENGTAAFEQSGKHKLSSQQTRVTALEEKLKRKNEVLSELMEEHVALKKSLGVI